jgi:hypothetical protein
MVVNGFETSLASLKGTTATASNANRFPEPGLASVDLLFRSALTLHPKPSFSPTPTVGHGYGKLPEPTPDQWLRRGNRLSRPFSFQMDLPVTPRKSEATIIVLAESP